MIERKIDELGRIVIPVDMRDKLGINPQGKLSIELDKNTIVIKKAECTCKLCGSNKAVDEEISVCSNCINMIKLR